MNRHPFWIIESGTRPGFYLVYQGGLGEDSNQWTPDPLRALRFAANERSDFVFSNSVQAEKPRWRHIEIGYAFLD